MLRKKISRKVSVENFLLTKRRSFTVNASPCMAGADLILSSVPCQMVAVPQTKICPLSKLMIPRYFGKLPSTQRTTLSGIAFCG